MDNLLWGGIKDANDGLDALALISPCEEKSRRTKRPVRKESRRLIKIVNTSEKRNRAHISSGRYFVTVLCPGRFDTALNGAKPCMGEMMGEPGGIIAKLFVCCGVPADEAMIDERVLKLPVSVLCINSNLQALISRYYSSI
jgi:hypothetical protein